MKRKSFPAISLTTAVILIIAVGLVTTVIRKPTTMKQEASGPTFSALKVSGNKLVNQQGQQIILRGVDRGGTEYSCVHNAGIFDGPSDAASIQAMKSWGINAVNIGLNEDCWLGINGVPTNMSGTAYQQAIISYVHLLESYQIYPILAYMWGASGTQEAESQPQMPDADHATTFWNSVASTFKGDNEVLFRLQEEPHLSEGDSTAAWQCWKNGGSSCSDGYTVVGFQSLVTTIRSTGATNIIQLPGIQWASTMDQFLTYKPTDPLNNEMAVVDVYPGGSSSSDSSSCAGVTCYNSQYAPVIAQMPFMAGEFGESVNGDVCAVTASNTFMDWMDQHNSGYLAWTWDTWSSSCGDLSLITSYDGTPKSPNGTNYKAHLLGLIGGTAPSINPTISIPQQPSTLPSPTGVTPTLYCIGSCSSTQPSPSENTSPATTTIPSGSPSTTMSQTPCPSPTPAPPGSHKSKHKQTKKGALRKFIQQLLNLIIKLLQKIERLLGKNAANKSVLGTTTVASPCNPSATPSGTPSFTPSPSSISLAPSTSPQISQAQAAGKLSWSDGYYVGWMQSTYPPSTVDWKGLTDLIQFSVMTNPDGSIQTTAHSLTPAFMQAAVATAHQNHVKILLSIGGDDDQSWDGACSSANRPTFIANLIKLMQQYGYDGIDLDIEQDFGYPAHTDYIACVSGLRNALDKITPRPVLTEAGDPDWQGYMLSQVAQYLDHINLMSYGTPASGMAAKLQNYTSRGVPKNKLGIGVGIANGIDTSAPDCQAKANYAVTNGYGGIMEWIVSQDNALHNGQAPCMDAIANYVTAH